MDFYKEIPSIDNYESLDENSDLAKNLKEKSRDLQIKIDNHSKS